jgi:hypothetical protein
MTSAIAASTAALTLTRNAAYAGVRPSHDTRSTMTNASACASVGKGAAMKSRTPRCNASIAAKLKRFPSARKYAAGSDTCWCMATMRAKKLRVLSPAKADQCSAARRTSPKAHDPSSQIPQNTPCITAFIVNAMSVADTWATIVCDLCCCRAVLGARAHLARFAVIRHESLPRTERHSSGVLPAWREFLIPVVCRQDHADTVR